MTTRVLFFGLTADIANRREMAVRIEGGLTAHNVLEIIRLKIPALGTHKLHISLNQQFATGDEIIQEGDELAVFTAVSGG